jgi:hypothetical protein
MVVRDQGLLPGMTFPAPDPGGVLFEAFVGAVTLADVADLVLDGTDEGVDVGPVLAGLRVCTGYSPAPLAFSPCGVSGNIIRVRPSPL